jgi:hypothetical protein
MKVTVKQQPEEFKPVTLEITLEGQKEIEMLYQLANYAPTLYDKIGYDYLRVYDATINLFNALKELRK